MKDLITRRKAMQAAAMGILGATSTSAARPRRAETHFEISLAEWSLHRAIRGGEMTNLDFPQRAKKEFGIEAIEYVNTFFKDKVTDGAYLAALRQRCDDSGVRSLLIMCDEVGHLGDPDPKRRSKAVEGHFAWVDAARVLGCHSIRVNAASEGARAEQAKFAADGLRQLTEFASLQQINVIVENHGGLSSDGSWLASVIRRVDHPRCGTLPDFGNFCLDWSRQDDPAMWYDRYKGVHELMPFAKGVSAKSHDFDEHGEERHTNFAKMLRIVMDAGYHGFIGIEYEGDALSESDGILATKRLLEKCRERLVG